LIDQHLDAVLRASGSALRHYTMQKSKDDMRAAMQAAMAAATPSSGASAVEDAARFAWLSTSDWYVGPPPESDGEAGGMSFYEDKNYGGLHCLRSEIDTAKAAEKAHGIGVAQ